MKRKTTKTKKAAAKPKAPHPAKAGPAKIRYPVSSTETVMMTEEQIIKRAKHLPK
jgi:hypothetical protein